MSFHVNLGEGMTCFLFDWTSKMPKMMAHYLKIESMGSIGSIVLGLFAGL